MILNGNYHILEYEIFQELVEHKSELAVFIEFNRTNRIAFGPAIAYSFDEDGLSLLL